MWTDEQLATYHQQGFLALPGLLDASQIAPLQAAADQYIQRYQGSDGPLTGDDAQRVHYVREKNGALRSLFAMHRQLEAYRAVIRLPEIAGPLKQIFNDDAYVFHSKLNIKEGFQGGVWMWHQDFGYWQYDGVDNRLSSVMIMLDKTTLHGGCLLFVPGSHKWGVLDHYSDEETTSYKQWCVEPAVLKEKIKNDDLFVPITGNPGDVFFFDCNLLHGSGHNLSPCSRKALIYACAAMDNKPKPVENPRPDWVVDRTFESVTCDIAATVA